MDRALIESLLNEVHEGRTTVNDAVDRLKNLPFEDIGFAKLDHHRSLRTGMPEVIFAAGKTAAQVAAIFARMAKAGGNVLATRASREIYEAVHAIEPRAEFHETARAITLTHSGQRNHRRGLRRDERPADCRRGRGDRAVDGQYR
jgi:hypothetical protein